MNARQLLSSLAFATSLVACAEAAAEPDEAASAAEINHDGPETTLRFEGSALKTVQPGLNASPPYLTSWQAETVWAFGDPGLPVGVLASEYVPDGCTLRKITARVSRNNTTSAMTMRVINGVTDYATINSGTTAGVGPELLNAAMSRVLPIGSDARVYVYGQGFQQGLFWIDVTFTCPD